MQSRAARQPRGASGSGDQSSRSRLGRASAASNGASVCTAVAARGAAIQRTRHGSIPALRVRVACARSSARNRHSSCESWSSHPPRRAAFESAAPRVLAKSAAQPARVVSCSIPPRSRSPCRMRVRPTKQRAARRSPAAMPSNVWRAPDRARGLHGHRRPPRRDQLGGARELHAQAAIVASTTAAATPASDKRRSTPNPPAHAAAKTHRRCAKQRQSAGRRARSASSPVPNCAARRKRVPPRPPTRGCPAPARTLRPDPERGQRRRADASSRRAAHPRPQRVECSLRGRSGRRGRSRRR